LFGLIEGLDAGGEVTHVEDLIIDISQVVVDASIEDNNLLSHGIEPGLFGLIEGLDAGGEVTYIEDLIVDVSQVVVDEIRHLGLGLHDCSIGVYEQRAREGIFVGLGSFCIGFDAAHRDGADDVGVGLGVGEAEVADGIGAASDALNQDIVIFGELDAFGSQDGGFAGVGVIAVGGGHHSFDEVIEGSGVGAGAEALDGFSGEGRVEVSPGDCGGESQGDLFDGQILNEVVLGGDDHRQGVGADAELDGSAADGCAVSDLFVLDRATGVGDIGLASFAEALEARPGANAVDGDLSGIAFAFEAVSHGFGKRVHSG